MLLSVEAAIQSPTLARRQIVVTVDLGLIGRRVKVRIGLCRVGGDFLKLLRRDIDDGRALVEVDFRRFPGNREQFSLVGDDEVVDDTFVIEHNVFDDAHAGRPPGSTRLTFAVLTTEHDFFQCSVVPCGLLASTMDASF
jgi:hypothetical protein